MNLDGGKMTTAFSLTLSFIFLSITNVGHKVTYSAQTPKMFGKFNKSHYLYFMSSGSIPSLRAFSLLMFSMDG